MRSQRSESMNTRDGSEWVLPRLSAQLRRRTAELNGQPSAGRAPIAKNRGFGNSGQFRGLYDVEPGEEAALDDHRLARRNSGKLFQRRIESEQFVGGGCAAVHALVERNEHGFAATAFRGLSASRGFDQDLAH